jgi:hypothetical protein
LGIGWGAGGFVQLELSFVSWAGGSGAVIWNFSCQGMRSGRDSACRAGARALETGPRRATVQRPTSHPALRIAETGDGDMFCGSTLVQLGQQVGRPWIFIVQRGLPEINHLLNTANSHPRPEIKDQEMAG